jgi:hypothetical protein
MIGDRRRWCVRGLAGMVMLAVLASLVSGPTHGGQDVPLRYVSGTGRSANLQYASMSIT